MIKIISMLVFCFFICASFASGTYVSPPPKPKPDVDCSKDENKDHESCQEEE